MTGDFLDGGQAEDLGGDVGKMPIFNRRHEQLHLPGLRVQEHCLRTFLLNLDFQGIVRRAFTEIGIDELALYVPGEIVGKGFYEHQVAGFGDKIKTVRGSDSVLSLGFVRISDEVISPLNEMPFVVVEPLPGGSLWSAVAGVDILKRGHTLAVIFLNSDVSLTDLDNGVRMNHSFLVKFPFPE